MTGRTIWTVVLGVVALALLVGVGIQLYEVGVAHGMSQGTQVATSQAPAPQPGTAPAVAPQAGVNPYPYYGYPPYRHWGWGFPFFGFLAALLFFFLIFALFRAAWRGPRGWGGRGPGGSATFDDWHRRAHERDQATETGQTTAT